MKTLRVYGDSFAATGPNNWPEKVANKLEIALSNKAVAGSSTEHAIKQFMHDAATNNINDGDVIIFVTSTPGRLHFQFQEKYPETASEYIRGPISTHIDHSWYRSNKRFIEWWLVNQDHTVMNLNQVAHVALVKDIARSKPRCTFVCLSNGPHLHNEVTGPNPINFLRSYTYLNNISINEVVNADETYYGEWSKHVPFDPRVNHLTNPNLEILANLVVEAIKTLDISNLTYDKFRQQIVTPIKTKKQYDTDCSNGFYSFSSWFYDRIKE